VWAEGFASKCGIPFDDEANDGCMIFNRLSSQLRYVSEKYVKHLRCDK
jgi:hypothetical protein